MTVTDESVTAAPTEEWDHQDFDTLASEAEPFPDEEEYDEDGIAQQPPPLQCWEW